MSALPLKADMLSVSIEVRFVPIADILAHPSALTFCWKQQGSDREVVAVTETQEAR
jgi:hypothetical protein